MNTDIGQLFSRIKLGDPKSVIGVVAMLAGLAVFVLGLTSWLSTSEEKSSMTAQADVTAASVEQIQRMRETGPEALRTQLHEIEAQLSTLKADFPSPEQTRAQVNSYYAVATQMGVHLTRLESVLPATQGASLPYTVERYAIEARGEFAGLLRFLVSVTQNAYLTFSFDNLALTYANPTVAQANLTVFAADAPAVARAPASGQFPALARGDLAEVERLQSVMQGAMAVGDWRVAVSYGQRILMIDPQRQDVIERLITSHIWYARQLSATGQKEQARQQLLDALARRPAAPELLAELEALDRR